MKTIVGALFLLLLESASHAQRGDITIPTGAEIIVPASSQLCADRYFANNPGYGTLSYGNDPARLCGSVIPVEFLSLSASFHDGRVTVHWRTVSETNCAGYEVQRSDDESAWHVVGYVAGRGTTANEHAYQCDDVLPPKLRQDRMLFYRLRQIDNDGTYDFSPIVEVNTGNTAHTLALHNVYPNPASDRITVQYTLPDAIQARISVYAMAGQEVAAFTGGELSGGGGHILSVSTTHLPPGGYLLELVAADTRLVQQFVVRR